MDRFTRVRWLLLLSVLFTQFATAAPIHHELVVTLKPEQGYLQATDQITLPEPANEISFSLNASLKLRLETSDARIISTQEIDSQIPIKQYRIRLPTEQKELKLSYAGSMRHRRSYRPDGNDMEREANAGIISQQGVFLSLSSFWFPVIDNSPVAFTLTTILPEGWSSISQGGAIRDDTWYQPEPQDDIYLVAGEYQLYKRPNDVAEAQVYLHRPDRELAQRFLNATEEYLQLYSKLLGPYPYPKFAMVENFWESGYGMPSFTLLGPRVLRLPFILHSSYPHEILHNWWGNGVFVDYDKGNWSEGMATYLADHLIQEQRGQGSKYRYEALQRYADYVTENSEYSLRDFRGYHGHASQAIGYGKTMMFLHMLRRHLGDSTFLKGLRLFYKDNLHRLASFEDMQRAFSQASGKDLSKEFSQWIEQTGAPALEIAHVSSEKKGWWDYRLSFTLRQTQKEGPYLIHVPVYIQTEDESEPVVKTVTFSQQSTTRTIELDDRPIAVSVDPLFDLFRRLDPSEIPSSLGQLLGADKITIILPSRSDTESREAYREMAYGWKRQSRGIEITWDNKIDEIPQDRAVWLFGRENLLAERFMRDMGNRPVSLQGQTLSINDRRLALADNSFVLTNSGAKTRGWLHCHSLAAFHGLERKIPHYSKYSYLAFSGDNPDNVLKGRWPLERSRLYLRLDKDAPPMELQEHRPLSDLVE